jgi:hypothetical protein
MVDMVVDTWSGIARGTCPRCASSDVTYQLIRMVIQSEADERLPEWVVPVGCVHPGYDRECATCGFTWQGLTFDRVVP